MESTYFKSIVSIRDKKDNSNVPLNTCSIQKITSMYSNTKIPIYKLLIDTKSISRNNSYLVLYTCQTCNIQSEITLNLFMRKVNKDTKCCESCRNNEKEKCKNQSQFMKENIHTVSTLLEKQRKSSGTKKNALRELYGLVASYLGLPDTAERDATVLTQTAPIAIASLEKTVESLN